MQNPDDAITRIAQLLKTGSAIDFRKSIANFEIGRLVAALCDDNREDGINATLNLLKSHGVSVQQGFLFDAYRVFRSIKTEERLRQIRGKLRGHLPWGYLVNNCTSIPEGDDEVTRQYWERQFARIEEGIADAEKLAGFVAKHIEQIPGSLLPQAEGVLTGVVQQCASEQASSYGPVRSVLHIGDEHFDSDANLVEVIKSAGHIVSHARQLRPDLIVSSGDLLNCRQSHDSPALSAAAGFVKELAEIAPVFILKGTTTHDGVSVGIFRTLKTRHRVYVAETLGMVGLKAGEFFALEEYRKDLDALIYAIPPATKAAIVAQGSGMNESSGTVAAMLRGVFDIWGSISDQARKDGVMTIVSAHGTVTGATTSTGQKMIGRDIEFGLSDLMGVDADVACLAHIHKAQSWPDARVFYCGSIAKLNVGETEDKGFWVHIKKPEGLDSVFTVIPTKSIVSQSFDGLPDLSALPVIQEGSLVRICYRVDEEAIHSVDEEALRAQLMAMGAAEVRIEKSVIPKQMVRAAGISKMSSLADKLAKWGETTGTVISETLRTKIDLLGLPKDVLFDELQLAMPRRRNGK